MSSDNEQSKVKQVAIIGAGISGITSAKSMLEQGLQPTVFDSKPHIGGIWADPPASKENPFLVQRTMRTNLSKYTCVFSDYSWKNAGLGEQQTSMFPRADEVAEYLSRYFSKFAKNATLMLGCTVRKLSPVGQNSLGAPQSWKVEYETSDHQMHTANFDFVVIATGFNSEGYIPTFTNQPSFKGIVLHGSKYTWDAVNQACQKTSFPKKRIVVVGGSLTAVELVGEIALSIASQDEAERGKYELVQLFSRPFWIIPKMTPLLIDDNTKSSTQPKIFPMDWVFYDLKATPAKSFNEYMKVLVGGDQSDLTPQLKITQEAMKSSSWVCLSDSYAGFARSGAVNTVIGRMLDFSSNDPYTIEYDTLDQSHTLAKMSEVSCVIMATGYTPYFTIEKFLDAKLFKDITSPTPGKPIDYTFLPFLLYKQVLHPAFGHIAGCVGLYKGPYFGVMELQAKWLAALFAGKIGWPTEAELSEGVEEMRKLRDNRSSAPPIGRAQWSMGDYVLTSQWLCNKLGIPWFPTCPDVIIDPFVPERLHKSLCGPQDTDLKRFITEVGGNKPVFVPYSVFCALQGMWNVDSVFTVHEEAGDTTSHLGRYVATAMFSGRGRTDLPVGDVKLDPALVQEFAYSESDRTPIDNTKIIRGVVLAWQHNVVFRLDIVPTEKISMDITVSLSPDSPQTKFRVGLQFYANDQTEGDEDPAWYAKGESTDNSEYKLWFEYAFWFDGLKIKCFKLTTNLSVASYGVKVQSVSTYTR